MKFVAIAISLVVGYIVWSATKFDKIEEYIYHIKVNEANIKHLMKGQEEIKQLIKERDYDF